jgi:hypothetical protein
MLTSFMAGKRQHYLPRFLQKGFSCRQNGKEIYTYVFKNNIEPYESNIINVGAESFFYGNHNSVSIDEEITEKELEFFPLLEELRQFSSDTRIQDKPINEFIIHLIIRTRHIRLSMEELGKSLLDIFLRHFGNPTKLNEMILRYIKANPDVLEESIRKGFAEQGITNIDSNVIKIATEFTLQNASQFLNSPTLLGMRLGLIHTFKLLGKDMSKLVVNSHLKALSDAIVPPSLLEKIRNLQWILIVKPPDSFILGDIGPLVRKTSGEFKALFLIEDDDIYQVFLPISDSHIIVGSKVIFP